MCAIYSKGRDVVCVHYIYTYAYTAAFVTNIYLAREHDLGIIYIDSV